MCKKLMPPKKPAPKGSAASSPRSVSAAAAPAPPKASPPAKRPAGKAVKAPPVKDQKGLLFAAFEGLVQIHPNEAKARIVVLDEEEAAFDNIVIEEMAAHLVISETEARLLNEEEESGVFAEFAFEESTHRQQLIAAMVSKKSIVGRKSSIVDAGLGARLARKKSRLDSELEEEESRLTKAAVNTSDPKAAMRADREKWLAQTEEVRPLVEDARAQYEVFCLKHNGKKFESKSVADERKALEAACKQLERRLSKLENLETKYQEREAMERQRVRRCSNLKGIDLGVITGERSVLQKASEIEIRRKHEEQNEILDENMFRQMVVQSDRDAFGDLGQHELAVRRRASELKALHGPAQAAPQPPPKLVRRQSAVRRSISEEVHLPPIASGRKEVGDQRQPKRTPRRPSGDNPRIPTLKSPGAQEEMSRCRERDSALGGSDHGDTIPSAGQSDDTAGGAEGYENAADGRGSEHSDVEVEC